MPLGSWDSFDFGPPAWSEKVAYALAELGFDPEDPGVLGSGNLLSVRDLLSSGYAAFEEQERRGLEARKLCNAEAGRSAALKEAKCRLQIFPL